MSAGFFIHFRQGLGEPCIPLPEEAAARFPWHSGFFEAIRRSNTSPDRRRYCSEQPVNSQFLRRRYPGCRHSAVCTHPKKKNREWLGETSIIAAGSAMEMLIAESDRIMSIKEHQAHAISKESYRERLSAFYQVMSHNLQAGNRDFCQENTDVK